MASRRPAVLFETEPGVYAAYEPAIESGRTDMGEDQRLIPAQRDNLTNEVSVNGSIRFPNHETLSFDIQDTAEDVLVQEGDRGEESQELAHPAYQQTPQGGVSVQTINVPVRDVDEVDRAELGIATLLQMRHRITEKDDFTVSSQQAPSRRWRRPRRPS